MKRGDRVTFVHWVTGRKVVGVLRDFVFDREQDCVMAWVRDTVYQTLYYLPKKNLSAA